MDGEKILDISWGSIFKIILAVIIFYVAFLIRNILVLFIFALIISVLFDPAIDFFVRRKIPRLAALVMVYFFIFGTLGAVIYLIAPIFVREVQQFTQFFPQYFDKFAPTLKNLGLAAFENLDTFTKALQDWLTQASSSILNAVGAIFGGIFTTITVFALAIFLSVEEKGVEKTISLLFYKKYETQVLNFWKRSQTQVAGWFGSRIVAGIFVGVLTGVACKILAVNYPITLGLFAGVASIVPFVGPIISGALLVLIAILDSWTKALFILVAFVLIHQIEGNLLTPFITKKFVGLPPVLVLLAVLIGGSLWGILGAILAIPFFGIIFEFLKDFLQKRRQERLSS